MKVSKIAQQLKRPDRYSIFVDGKYSFSLSESALFESKLASGQELSKEQVTQFKKLSADDKVYNQALRYAAMRQRSTWEMESYLQRKKAAPPLQKSILSKLSNIGLLNDEEFTRVWVANRRLLKPTSLRRLKQELRAKRVSDEIIGQVLEEDETDELDTLRELVDKKRKQVKYHDNQKLMQYLARQGFNYDDIKSVLNEEDVN
ncbi:MAG TPA: RecX family transcriptional regulator [Candidatus Saccharimonadales bacterium]|nr:RecX family transcriptional regulator [Candidatus Saccharimonadales bacterium]